MVEEQAAGVHPVVVEIAADAMSATMALEPSEAGARPSPDELLALMREAGVVAGIDELAVHLLSLGEERGPVVVARGVAPVPGLPARFELLVSAGRDRAPRADEAGLVDFRDLGDVPIVEAGQALMRRTPATAGTPGWTVRGEQLEPEPGQDEPFQTPLQGAMVDAADADLLRASCKGHPVRSGNAVMVEPVFRTPGVDMRTGHIHFDGAVQIDGDVAPGMKVQASGDIVVTGTVEGGELDAGGDIRITGGAIARARLQAKGSIDARFLECARASAGRALLVKDSALHSELLAGDQIVVGDSANKREARLVGGTAQARLLIRAATLGSPSATNTRVVVGVDQALQSRMAETTARLAAEQEQLHKLEQLAGALKRKGDGTGTLERVQGTMAQTAQAMARTMAALGDIEQQMGELRRARVEVAAAMAGDVELRIGQRLCRPRDARGPLMFRLSQDGGVESADAHGLALPLASV